MSPRIATKTNVDHAELLEFVRPRHHMVLVTRRRDGTPQVSPVTGGVDAQGRIVISSYPERAKVKNARRDSTASVLVLSDDWNDACVQIDGKIEVLDIPDAIEPLVEYFRVIAGEHDDWDEYRTAMIRQGKCLLRLTPEHWGPLATGGFPPELAS
jgi:PPOX class probable F420-dependent enzyme